MALIECIPNFSEGRRPEVIAAIRQAIAAVPGAYVLDTHIDADHHRSVITFAGEHGPVAEAAFRAVEQAAASIDMRQHQGQHPRIGATDVLPFVPIRGATLAECAELAREVAARIGAELHIPVYLYGAAATRPERRELPALRVGEYEGLKEAITSDPTRAPDFGPSYLGSAGATVVGAREPLIAYNLFLNTSDVTIAKRVARAVRGSSGGLRGVRALGMLVDNRAQVSMNLTDYRHTPVHRAVDMVAREAALYGAMISSGELVGLIPEDALFGAARASLRLPNLGDGQILERRLAGAMASTHAPEATSVSMLTPIWHHAAQALVALAFECDDTQAQRLAAQLRESIVTASTAEGLQEAIQRASAVAEAIIESSIDHRQQHIAAHLAYTIATTIALDTSAASKPMVVSVQHARVLLQRFDPVA